MSKERIIEEFKNKADEQTIKAEGLEEAIGEGGTETFSEEQLFNMRADMVQAYRMAKVYEGIIAEINKN
jgi:hypothetical protein